MKAYIDESIPRRSASPYMCVGGYLFKEDKAEDMSRKWDGYLKSRGIQYFHMTDCATGNGQFKTWKVSERDKLVRNFIRRIKQTSAFGFSVSIDVPVHEGIFQYYNEIPSAYALACFASMILIRKWADRANYEGDIFYIFEAGHKDQKNANQFILDRIEAPDKKKSYRYIGHEFAEKEKEPLLQSGDLMAWQHSKSYVNQLEGRPIRRDFQALVRPGDKQMEYKAQDLMIMAQALVDAGQLTVKKGALLSDIRSSSWRA